MKIGPGGVISCAVYGSLKGQGGDAPDRNQPRFVFHRLVFSGRSSSISSSLGSVPDPAAALFDNHATDFFHGARISDVRSTVTALRRSLPEHTPLVVVGYSMGGIIATNYAALTGENSGVSCCVSMSGSFDTRWGGTDGDWSGAVVF